MREATGSRCMAAFKGLLIAHALLLSGVLLAGEQQQSQLSADASPRFTWIKPLAEQGNMHAQLTLGRIYSSGEGVEQDDELAVHWWLKAAEQGSAEAQNELGAALSDGRGAPQDQVQAMTWFQKAVDQGLAVAQANLGVLYWSGLGVRRDLQRAVGWYARAAEQGLGWAQFFLGNAYATGRGIRQDTRQAVHWYRRAAEQDYPDAQTALGRLYVLDRTRAVRRDYASAVHWLSRAALLGNDESEKDLRIVLPRLRKVRVRGALEIRDASAPSAGVIRTADAGEYVYELRRLGDWVEVYLPDGHVTGYVGATQLNLK